MNPKANSSSPSSSSGSSAASSSPSPSPSPSLMGGVARVAQVVGASVDLVFHVLQNVNQLVEGVTTDSMRVAAEAQALSREVLAAAEQARVAARATPRFLRVVGEVARIAAAYKLRGPSEELHAWGAERLYALCIELRGPLLKLGQLASARADLLPRAYIDSLSRLQDRVPPVEAAAIRARVEAELGRPIAEVFATFDDEAIAAASLAQVHAATLLDGTAVVAKVQLPGVEELIEADMAALRVLARTLGDMLPKIDLGTIVAELARSIREELDYAAEAEHAAAIGAAFAGSGEIVVPRVHAALSTGRLLVLERLVGDRLIEFLDGADQAGRDRVLGALLRAYAAQILAHGRFQADAHPGNFLVLAGLDGPKLGLLDFGCVKTLPPSVRRGFVGLAMAILTRDAARAAVLFRELGFEVTGDDPRALDELAELLMGALREGGDIGAIDPEAQLRRGLEILRDNPIAKLPSDFVLIGRVFASLGGLFATYKPRLDAFGALAPHLAAAA